ncbi:MAG: hypothetical protein ACE15D_15175 [Candidatus Eisenbacteria bacterium]
MEKMAGAGEAGGAQAAQGQARGPASSDWRDAVFWTAAGAAVFVGLARAISLRWVSDDAFITFRYVDNLLAGRGLVYNAGERVEGYTHFLWLMLLAVPRALGADPVVVSEVLGIVAFVGTIALLAWISSRVAGRGPAAASPPIPLAAVLLALHFDAAIWATGGLETSLFTLLLTGVVVAAWRCSRPHGAHRRRDDVTLGLLLGLHILTRPDGVLLYPVALGAALLPGAAPAARPLRDRLVWLHAPLALLLGPWILWKLAYYGSIVPNTYYAKGAGGAWFSQGFRYLWLYSRAYVSSAVLFVAAAAWLVARLAGRRHRPGPARARLLNDPALRMLLLCVVSASLYLVLFVARVGGDFMFARFVVPVLPLLYLSIEIALARWLGRRRVALAAACVLLALAVLGERTLRDSIYFDDRGEPRRGYGPWGIADEHWYWSHRDAATGQTLIERYRQVGRQLAVYFDGEDVRVLTGGQASLAYYGRFAVAIEAAGLTDRTIAHLRIEKHGRPGHEKLAPTEYLVRRGVHFEFGKRPRRSEEYRQAYFRVGMDAVRAEIFTYDAALFARLRERFPDAVSIPDFEGYLDGWLATIDGRPRNEVRREYEDFRDFYFMHNEDPAREQRVLAHSR